MKSGEAKSSKALLLQVPRKRVVPVPYRSSRRVIPLFMTVEKLSAIRMRLRGLDPSPSAYA